MEFIERICSMENEFLENLCAYANEYVLATIHREDNTDREEKLRNLFSALNRLASNGVCIFFPAHPRARKFLERRGLLACDTPKRVMLSEPVSYREMLALERNARVVVTDFGVVQKETFFFKMP
jgi:UDP-N-acetylglucosamine 2-epimerase